MMPRRYARLRKRTRPALAELPVAVSRQRTGAGDVATAARSGARPWSEEPSLPGRGQRSGGSTPNSVPTTSSIASNGSGRTTSPRSAVSTVRYPSGVYRMTVSVSSRESTSQ